ncbi:DUF7563 family protein [Halorarius halobius]|uniref:DUF7563 family protein n=1 Tax=Halorarius halobius TaxID=2962671 RepID=UPI00331310BF
MGVMQEIQQRSTSRPRCRNCGSPVSRRFCRVFGDNQDDVYGCMDCTSMRKLTKGAATSK